VRVKGTEQPKGREISALFTPQPPTVPDYNTISHPTYSIRCTPTDNGGNSAWCI